MKKTATILAAILMASVQAGAQTAGDALLFSENDYEGTARTIAMGNAFTALGGDLGSVTFNPAGTAVSKYSQFSFTPGITFSTNTAQGIPYDGEDLTYFQRQMQSNTSSLHLPNIGMIINWDTYRTTGLKNISLGFTVNRTNSWNEDVYADGTNSKTSFMGAMAYGADGLIADNLGMENAFNHQPWKETVGYQSGMIAPYATDPNGGDMFMGASEARYANGDIAVPGQLTQTYGRNVQGGKFEYLVNLAANFSDFLYVGASIGLTSMSYDYNEYFKEKAVDPSKFENAFSDAQGNEFTIFFKDMLFKYNYSASGAGYFGKAGFILTPGAGFRIGAAIQTPSVMNIYEQWCYSGATSYTDGAYDAESTSPWGEFEYTLVSPYRANFGLAYTIGNFAVISADYEFADYGQMKFQTTGNVRDYFEELNSIIKSEYGMSHLLRAGVEVKPLSMLAIRAGYNFTTSPEKNLPVTYRQNASFGLGYTSNGSFFADIACRYDFVTSEQFMPYADYIFDENDNIAIPAPEILNRHSLWKVYLTLGWRF